MSNTPDLRLPYHVAVALVQVLRALPVVQVYEAMTQLQPADAPPAPEAPASVDPPAVPAPDANG